MERSFLEYSMSVIVARVLPDVRDGLKPVHRRILYSMFDNGCDRTVPTTCAQRSWARSWRSTTPTANSAIYEALARMVEASRSATR